MPSRSIPAHQWTNGGSEVLILKCVNRDGTSYGGFKWPLEIGKTVIAPDWNPEPKCGGGLHGWPWGLSIGEGKEADWSGKWVVFGTIPDDIIDLGGKCKAHSGVIRFVGNWHDSLMFVLHGQMAWVFQNARSSAASSGASSSAASSGHRSSAASSGDSSSAASSGHRSSAASSGDSSSAASSGHRSSAASSGLCSPAVCSGLGGRAKAGPFGCIALAWWNEKYNRAEIRCAEVGRGDGTDKKLKAGIWYELDLKGKFVEVSNAK